MAEPIVDEQPPIDDGQKLVTEEGAWGRVRVQTPDGPMLLSYQVVDGHAIHETDMDLGPVERLLQRGGAARLGMRWPNGVIKFAFEPEYDDYSTQVCGMEMVNCVNSKQRVRDTLAAMEKKLPLDFREVAYDDIGSQDVVLFRYIEGQETAGASSHTGMEGGVQHIKFRLGHEKDSQPDSLHYHLEPSTGTIRHEMLHAAGIWHEQSRNDRNEFVEVNYQCIKDGEGNGNYDIKDESADLGPYDFASIMHYSPTTQCIAALPWFDPDGDGCTCKTMTPIPSGAVIDAEGPAGFSIEDANTVFRMYAKPPGSNTSGDQFGKALASGDFDNDGYTDLAVGIPDEDLATGLWPNTTTVTNAGMVSLWKGTSNGLVAWRTLTAASFGGQSIAANARFGAAVVAYDVNADGIEDLAIGAPGAAGGAGAVFVFRGTTNVGVVEHRFLTQANTAADDDTSGDRFGETLAAGPITGAVRADACGPNLPIDALVVGAPGDRVGTSSRGSVFIFQETTPSCAITGTLNKPTVLAHAHTGAASGDDFGVGLAVGDLDSDGLADLAVGAPMFGGGAGTVFLYKGRLPTENPFAWSAMATEQNDVVVAGTSRFGKALAIGNVLPTSGRELVVGAPGNAGKVVVFAGGFTPVAQVTLTDTTQTIGDEFGAALAIGDVDRASTSEDLVVGVPGESSDAGKAIVFRGGLTGLPTRATLLSSQLVFGDNDAGDRFGAAFAIGSFDGGDGRTHTATAGTVRLDLAVGAPGEKPDFGLGVEDTATAGAIDVFHGTSGAVVSPWQQRHQENSGRASDP